MIFFLLFVWAVNIFWILILYWSYHLQIFFSRSVGIFILLVVYFAIQKSLSLIRLHLLIFAYIFFASGDRSKEITAVIYVKECSVFYSRSFIVFGLTFWSLIHFEFIFVYDVRECSDFVLLHVANCPVFPARFTEKLSFFHCIFLPPLQIDWFLI